MVGSLPYRIAGRILTAAPERPVSDAVLIEGGRVGIDERDAPTIHLPRWTVAVPGFVDPHLHLLAMAAARLSVDVSGDRSIAALCARVARGAQDRPSGGWIRARGYDAWRLDDGRSPNRHDLDAVVPAHPVAVHDATGHEVVCNTLALRRLGIERVPRDDRRVERSGDEPTGRLHHAEALLNGVEPFPISRLRAAMAEVGGELAAAGVTAVTDATHTNGTSELELLASWVAEEVLPQRIELMIGVEHVEASQRLGFRFGTRLAAGVTVGHVKVIPEALRARTLADTVEQAHAAGFPVAVHVLDVGPLAEALEALGGGRGPAGRRDRLEHVALALPEQVAAIARAGLDVVTHPAFTLRRATLYERDLSPVEQGWLYRVGSLVDAGVRVAAASDAPVVPAGPLESMRAAVVRPSRLTREERVAPGPALDLVTRHAGAVGSRPRGTLRPGAPADLVILDGEPAGEATSVLATLIGGRPAFDPDELFAGLRAPASRAAERPPPSARLARGCR